MVRKGATAAKYAGSLQWIEDAGIINLCYNLSLPELPLNGNAMEDSFKVYMKDTGLLIRILDDGTRFDVLQGKLYNKISLLDQAPGNGCNQRFSGACFLIRITRYHVLIYS